MTTQATASFAPRRDEQELLDERFAMRLSLIFGLAMLIGKTTAYFMTHSAAIFSDAAESVIHVIAVGFASFSLRLSTRSASPQFLYGYERITFFSAGFEGAMIVVAAIAILFESIRKWIAGLQLEHLGIGVLLVLMAGVLNAGLGRSAGSRCGRGSCWAMSTISWVRGASRMGRPSSGGPLQLLKTKGTVCILHVYTWWRLAWARHEYSGAETVRQYGCQSNFY